MDVRINNNVIVFLAEIVLIFAFVSCGYTILKIEPNEKKETQNNFQDDYFLEVPENLTADEKLQILCTTWKGIIVKRTLDKPVDIDTVFKFTINQDGTFVLDSQIGFFEGCWTFEDEKNGFSICLNSMNNNSSKWMINQCHRGYFRHWGLQLGSFSRINVFNFMWYLTRRE